MRAVWRKLPADSVKMPSLLINNKEPSGHNRRSKLWEFVESNNLIVQAIRDHRSNFVLILDDTNLDKFLSNEIVLKLNAIKFELKVPLEYTAKKTIVIKGVDERILNKPDDEIINELKNNNDWINSTDSVNIIRIPNSTLLKITLNSAQQANLALERGLPALFG